MTEKLQEIQNITIKANANTNTTEVPSASSPSPTDDDVQLKDSVVGHVANSNEYFIKYESPILEILLVLLFLISTVLIFVLPIVVFPTWIAVMYTGGKSVII